MEIDRWGKLEGEFNNAAFAFDGGTVMQGESASDWHVKRDKVKKNKQNGTKTLEVARPIFKLPEINYA